MTRTTGLTSFLLVSLTLGHRVSAEPAKERPPPVLPCPDADRGMACVPGGWFVMGNDNDRHVCEQRKPGWRRVPNAAPAHRVWVQTFLIDRFEVTYREFEKCIDEGSCDRRPEDGRWGPLYSDFSRPRQPAAGINWFQARQYCRTRGADLPTEAQWELAARGLQSESHPWGESPATCRNAVIKVPKLGRSCGAKKKGNPDKGRALVVGSRPAARFGTYDLIGNIEEWVLDWYSHDYAACGDGCLGVEPRGPCDGAERCPGHDQKVVRGGSWYWDASHATGWHRRPHYPDNEVKRRYHHFGFRCARSLVGVTQ